MHVHLRLALALAAASAMAACQTIGPGSIQRDRMDYAAAISDSWKEQALLNIIKLRYFDTPVFLDVASVISSYTLQSQIDVAATQTVLVVHPSIPIKSVNGLIALAKSRPRSLHYGSAGNGSISHMGMELFRYLTGATLTHVPYKGEGQTAVDVMSGQIGIMFPNMPTVLGIGTPTTA